MRRGIISIFMLVIVSKLPAQSVQNDVVYLKNGGVIQGQVIEQIPGVLIKIKTRDGKVFEYKWENIEKISKAGGVVKEIRSRKSPIKAFLLSLIFPGLGQYYNGEREKGYTQQAIFFSGLVLGFIGATNLNLQLDNKGVQYSEESFKLVIIGLCISSAASLWSIIDAPISAIKINRKYEKNFSKKSLHKKASKTDKLYSREH